PTLIRSSMVAILVAINSQPGLPMPVQRHPRPVTTRNVEVLQPGKVLWDREVGGFGVRRQRDTRVYFLKTRTNGRQRWITIGAHGAAWTVVTARREARRLLGEIASGKDPAAAKAAAKGAPFVDDLIERYLAEHVVPHNRPRTARTVRQIINSRIRPALGK